MPRPPRPPPPSLPPLALLTLFVALAAGVGPGAGGGPGVAGVVLPPPGGGPAGAAGANATAATPGGGKVKDLGFGPIGYGRGNLESVLAAVFNKVAKGTTATPMTTRAPPTPPTTAPPPTTSRPATTSTARPATAPPQATELVPLPPLPLPPPGAAGAGGGTGATPIRRAPHPLPDYAPPNRPPPLPAEYNPFANKAILRGSQSEVGSAGPGRKPHPQLLPPRPPMDELIPLRPVNTPSQGGAAGSPGPTGPHKAEPSAPQAPDALRPERPPDRPPSSGHSGKHHLDSHLHTVASAPGPAPAVERSAHQPDSTLKAAKPTELLDQVNKDSIIDVQAEVAVVADPAIHRDEDNREKLLVLSATSPPSPPRPGGAGGVGGTGSAPGPVSPAGPVGATGGEWHVAWTAQVYGLGTMWGVLAVLCLLAAIWVNSRTRLLPRVHFLMLLALLLALAAANAVSLFYDVLREGQRDQLRPPPHLGDAPPPAPPRADSEQGADQGADQGAARVPQLLADLTLPFLPAAFSVFFFVVLRVNHVPCGSSGVPQTPVFLVLLFLFLATSMSLEVASCAVSGAGGGGGGGGGGATGMRSAARGLTLGVAALLGLAYLAVYRPLRRAAAKKQAEQVRAAYTAFRRLPAPALPRVVNALLACALLLVSLAAMAAYRLMDDTLIGSNADWRAPPWWYFRLAEHAGSLLVAMLLLWGATRGPSRGSEERPSTSRSSRSSRGTPGALSLVSCTGRRFLFDCPSTGSEENKTSEDNTYPAVCASNHAILSYTQHSKLYDDSFPLANLHSAPLNSSGDDFGNVPTMPKRASRGAVAGGVKAGTLLPYGKAASRRTAGAGLGAVPGHHTLGPGGQLYDAERDTLRRGSRTTGRTRKARHGHGGHGGHGSHAKLYSNCPQDEEHDQRLQQRLDGLADDFQVFKQYASCASTASSESNDNYDVPILSSAPPPTGHSADGMKRHRRREDGRSLHLHQRRTASSVTSARHPDSLSPPSGAASPAASPGNSPSDLSDCDRLSSNRSSNEECESAALSRTGRGQHAGAHHHHRTLLYDASEDDVTPDSAVVADMSQHSGQHSSPREKRAGKRAGRRHSPTRPYSDNAWPP